MNKLKDYIKTLLKLAIQNNPEVLKVVRNAKVKNYNPNHDEEGKFCSGSNVNYTSYGEYETEFLPYIEETPLDYEINNFEEALKDLGITEGKPLKISNPYETVNVTFESIKHIISGGGDGHEPDTSRYKSVNKMLATLKDPNLITEDNSGKKRYFKLFDDKNKVKRQFVILFNENDIPTVYTTMPVNKDKQYFLNQVNAGKPVYKKGQTRVIKNSAANNIITDIQEDFNPNIKNNVQNNKEQDMALLDELKKLITKVENDKGEDMDDEKKIENEKVDKRKLIDEVAGIMKSAGADDEKIRTAKNGKTCCCNLLTNVKRELRNTLINIFTL